MLPSLPRDTRDPSSGFVVAAALLGLDPEIDVPVLVLGNKSDVLGAATPVTIQEEVCRAAGLSQGPGSTREYRLFMCSAKRDEGLAAAVDWLVQAAKLRSQAALGPAARASKWGLC